MIAVFIQETGEEGIVHLSHESELEGIIAKHPEWVFSHLESGDFEYWMEDLE